MRSPLPQKTGHDEGGETIIMFRAKKKRIRPKKEESALSFPVPWVDPVLSREVLFSRKKKSANTIQAPPPRYISHTHAETHRHRQTERERSRMGNEVRLLSFLLCACFSSFFFLLSHKSPSSLSLFDLISQTRNELAKGQKSGKVSPGGAAEFFSDFFCMMMN